MVKRSENVSFGGVSAEEFDGADAVGVEGVVDVVGEVAADDGGGEGDARGPVLDEILDMQEAVITGVLEVLGELFLCDLA